MASVLGIADMFIEDEELLDKFDDFHKEMLIAISDQITKVLDYNNKLYHWSNLELGNFKLEIKQIHLSTLTDDVKNVFINKLKEKNIDLIENIPEDIQVLVDETLFSQVLNNLIGNAIKFTPENGVIKLYAEQSGNNVLLNIEDSGVGIPDNKINNLFSGFNSDSTQGTKGEKGSGLGLGIVKKILDAHDFKIEIKSTLNIGTKFIISIPSN